MVIYNRYIWTDCDGDCKRLLHLMYGLLIGLDTIINCIMIYMSFEFGQRLYFTLCSCCSKCCNRCCVRWTRNKSVKDWTEGKLSYAVESYITHQLQHGDDGYAELGALEETNTREQTL